MQLTWRTRFFEFCFASTTKTAGLPELEVAPATAVRGKTVRHAAPAKWLARPGRLEKMLSHTTCMPRLPALPCSPQRRSATALRLPSEAAERWPASVMAFIESVRPFISL